MSVLFTNKLKCLVLSQLVTYIDEEAFLSPTISGFQKGHSTITALLEVIKD